MDRRFFLSLVALVLVAGFGPGEGAAQIVGNCSPAVYTPPTQGGGMTGTVMVYGFTSPNCVGTMTFLANNPYGENFTECTVLGPTLIGNSMFTIRAMVQADLVFPKRCSWAFNVFGTTGMTFMSPCDYHLYGNGGSNGQVCRMRTPGGQADGLPVELMEFEIVGEDEDENEDGGSEDSA